jgi:pSer/pThr/pTyr-binding forkhead associated (FHA) protein
MFALEIQFHDGKGEGETIMVRRPQALIGAQEFAHVVIEDMRELGFQVRIAKDLSKRFKVTAVPEGEKTSLAESIEGIYDGEAELNLGTLTLHITSLDSDLLLRDGEAPDRAGIRAFRRASSYPSPFFPAVVIAGAQPIIFSFDPETPLLVGRSNQCPLRLESADISSQHAKIGFENGQFWIEDLGSKNGTFVNNQQVAGRVEVAPGTLIVLGREISIVGVIDERQIGEALRGGTETGEFEKPVEVRYPVLLSLSEVARPARFALPVGETIHIGRDPTSDIWLGAPHVSRLHMTITLKENGEFVVHDYSTNGTFYGNTPFAKAVDVVLPFGSHAFDFGGGVTLSICSDGASEQKFIDSSGSVVTFVDQNGANPRSAPKFAKSGAASATEKVDRKELRVLLPFIQGFRSMQALGKAVVVLVSISLIFVVYFLVSVVARAFV